MFPNGCSKCGSEVLFLEASEYFNTDHSGYVYACSNPVCDCYVKAHGVSVGVAVAGHPIGILADKDLRNLHELVRSRFSVLWQKKIINYLIHEYVVSFTDEYGETKYGQVVNADKENKTYLIRTETGVEYNVPISKASKTDSRSRSYFWLASQLGKSVYEAQIGMLNETESYAAIDVIDNAIKQLNIKPDERTN